MRLPVIGLVAVAALGGCAGPPGAPAPSRPAAPAPEGPVQPETPEEAWGRVEPIALEAPPWSHTLTEGATGRRAVVVPRLTRLMEAPNSITDDAEWLARNGFEAPGSAEPSRPLPFLFRGEPRARVIEQPGWTLAVYGSPTSGRYLLVAGDDGSRRGFDFASYLHAPDARPGETAAWPQDLLWAAIDGERLYVSHAHLTYAATTGGLNGFVTAVDLETGALLWRSRPLVSNARTFEIVDDALITGYGFTAEPDALFVIDRYTGEVLNEAPVRTAPTWILRRDGRLFVRAYDADYVFAIR